MYVERSLDMEKSTYSLGFIFSYDYAEVLLQVAACKWMENRWNGIGGHYEAYDNSPYQTITRETKEETGIIIQPEHWIKAIVMDCPGGVVHVFYATKDISVLFSFGDIPKQALQIFPVTDLPKHRMTNLDWMIPLCIEQPLHPVYVVTDKLGTEINRTDSRKERKKP
jgi:8-oxo-dGTP pyrophosphatase MutT (NUDIX family)